MDLKMFAKWWPFYIGLSVLRIPDNSCKEHAWRHFFIQKHQRSKTQKLNFLDICQHAIFFHWRHLGLALKHGEERLLNVKFKENLCNHVHDMWCGYDAVKCRIAPSKLNMILADLRRWYQQPMPICVYVVFPYYRFSLVHAVHISMC